jgi:hypothetical protein
MYNPKPEEVNKDEKGRRNDYVSLIDYGVVEYQRSATL